MKVKKKYMEKFITAVMNVYFLHTLYGRETINKLASLINGYELDIKEVTHNNTKAVIRVSGMISITFSLTPNGYVKKIAIKELS